MPRAPHPPQHRYSRIQQRSAQRAYHVGRVLSAVRVLNELLTVARWQARGLYHIPPELMSKAKAINADAIGYATADENGYQL